MKDSKRSGNVRSLLKENKIEEALTELELIINSTELLDELTIQFSRYNSLKRYVNQNIIKN